MNKGFQMIVGGAILGIATLAAMASAARVSAQGKKPGRPPMAAGALTQGKPAALPPAAASTSIPGRKTASGEQFFIVASLDLQKSQLLLKYPTEVTLLVRVDNSTKFADESGKSIKLSDLRAGDTVWVVSANGKDEAAAISVRKGQMTVADLHRYYLDYAEIK